MGKKELTQERLKEVLNYDPETGVFTWRVNPNRSGLLIGTVAGTKVRHGYIRICFENVAYFAHRLAYLYMTGVDAPETIDHANGVTSDNRWVNLRDCSMANNQQNRAARGWGSSGLTGAFFDKRQGRWFSSICLGRKNHYLGTFETKEAAHQAYLKAKAQLHTFNPIPRDLCTTTS